MSLERLKQYLNSIEQGIPVNLVKFTAQLSQLALSHRFSPADITARKVKGQQYCITHINSELERELQHLIASIGNDRVSAARQNRSHNHKVDGSLLVVRQGLQHPNVVLFDELGKYQYPNNQSQLRNRFCLTTHSHCV